MSKKIEFVQCQKCKEQCNHRLDIKTHASTCSGNDKWASFITHDGKKLFRLIWMTSFSIEAACWICNMNYTKIGSLIKHQMIKHNLEFSDVFILRFDPTYVDDQDLNIIEVCENQDQDKDESNISFESSVRSIDISNDVKDQSQAQNINKVCDNQGPDKGKNYINCESIVRSNDKLNYAMDQSQAENLNEVFDNHDQDKDKIDVNYKSSFRINDKPNDTNDQSQNDVGNEIDQEQCVTSSDTNNQDKSGNEIDQESNKSIVIDHQGQNQKNQKICESCIETRKELMTMKQSSLLERTSKNCLRIEFEKSKSEAQSLMKKQIETKNELEKMQLDYDNLKAELTCKSIKIQYLEKSKEMLKNDGAILEEKLQEELQFKNNQIKFLEKSKSEADNQYQKHIKTKNELEKTKLENDNLKAELTCKSIKIKYLEKSKEIPKNGQENQLDKLKNELNQKNAQIKSLEELNTKYRKLKQLLATKVFLSNSSDEDLETLINFDVEKLFEKYEEIMRLREPNNTKLEESLETLNNVKSKLNIQIDQREIYESQHSEMMDILNIPPDTRSVPKIIRAIRDLKNTIDQNETNHYANAQEILDHYQNSSQTRNNQNEYSTEFEQALLDSKRIFQSK